MNSSEGSVQCKILKYYMMMCLHMCEMEHTDFVVT
jgi:hypothetical protein